MLIGPFWLLQHLVSTHSSPEILLGVMSGFLILFTVLASLFTTAKPIEVLGATAAYVVVLVVSMHFGTHAIERSGG